MFILLIKIMHINIRLIEIILITLICMIKDLETITEIN